MHRLTLLTLGLFLTLASTTAPGWSQEGADKDATADPGFGFPLDPLAGTGLPGTEPDEKVVFDGSFQVEKGQRRGRLAITVQSAPTWHIYSQTQPDGGPQRSQITVTESPAFKVIGPFRPDREPYRHDDPIYPGVPIEEFDETVVFTAPIELAADTDPEKLAIEVFFDGQVCTTNGTCLPIEHENVPIQFGGFYVSGEHRGELTHVTLRGHLEPAVATPGSTVRVTLTAEPDAEWHIYAYAKQDDQALTEPTLILLTENAGWVTGPVTASAKPVEKDTELKEQPIQHYHEQPVSWTIDLTVPQDATPGEFQIGGFIGYQTCDAKGCDPPTAAQFQATLVVADEEQTGQVLLTFQESKYSTVRERVAPKVAAGSDSLAGMHPVVILFLAFLAGLILNVMPCVLPVIGLKIMAFVQQAGQSRMQVFALNFWYSLGLLFVFWILATTAFFLQVGWGDQFSSVGFNVVLMAVVFVFGLSLLGVWEIPIPGLVGSGKASELTEKEGYFGAFCKGALTTVLATPCTGPFLGPAIGWAIKQPVVMNYITFTCVGLGMATPYLLIGAFPKLISILPKPGAWMNTFKEVMGFVLMGTVVFIFFFLDKQYTVQALSLLVALGFSCWLIGRTPFTATGAQKMRAWAGGTSFAVLTAVSAFYLVPYLLTMNELSWEPYNRGSLDNYRAEGRTILVDFTADW